MPSLVTSWQVHRCTNNWLNCLKTSDNFIHTEASAVIVGWTVAQVVGRAGKRQAASSSSIPGLVIEVCGGKNDSGAAFLRVLRFPLPILIPPTAAHQSSSTRIFQGWSDVPSGQSHPTVRNECCLVCFSEIVRSVETYCQSQLKSEINIDGKEEERSKSK
jgi:hypothetical protein